MPVDLAVKTPRDVSVTPSDIWERYQRTFPRSPERRGIQEEIVKKYLYLVKFVVRKMNVTPPRELDYEDILSYGKMGLLDAIDRYDPSKGFTFQTYAASRVRGAVLDELRRFDWISRSGREKIQALDRASEEEFQASGRVCRQNVRQRLGMGEKQFRELLEIANRSFVVCLDELITLEDSEVGKKGILADGQPLPQEVVEHREEVSRVIAVLSDLPERDRRLSISTISGIGASRRSQRSSRSPNPGFLSFTSEF
jgi:RNA polymerase sigma factor for flagellar operon FliA